MKASITLLKFSINLVTCVLEYFKGVKCLYGWRKRWPGGKKLK